MGKCGRGAHLQGALRASRATFGMEGCCGSDAHNSSWACAPPESTDSRCCNPFSGPGGFPRSLLRRGSATFTSSTCGPSGHFLDPPGLSMGAGAVAGEFRALALAAVVAAAVATIFRVVMTCHQRPLYLPTLQRHWPPLHASLPAHLPSPHSLRPLAGATGIKGGGEYSDEEPSPLVTKQKGKQWYGHFHFLDSLEAEAMRRQTGKGEKR